MAGARESNVLNRLQGKDGRPAEEKPGALLGGALLKTIILGSLLSAPRQLAYGQYHQYRHVSEISGGALVPSCHSALPW
jgi:hypothetical protein